MPHQTFPEDSTLRRHFDSTVEMKRQRWLQQPPTDSILSRHNSVSDINRTQSTSALKNRSTPPQSPNSHTSTINPSVEEKPHEKGFLAKFFSLFSRNA